MVDKMVETELSFRVLAGHHGRFGRGASLYHHQSQLSARLWVRFPCRPGSFLRFNSRPVIYGTIGSLASNGVVGPSIWLQFTLEPLDLNHVMTLSKLCTYTYALANQALHPFGVGKLVPEIYWG